MTDAVLGRTLKSSLGLAALGLGITSLALGFPTITMIGSRVRERAGNMADAVWD